MKVFRSVIAGVILILLLGTLAVIFNNKKVERKEKMVDCAVFLSSIVVDLVRCEEDVDTLKRDYGNYLCDSIEEQILEYKRELQSKKDLYVDLDEVYAKKYSGVFHFEGGIKDPPVNEIEYTQEEIELYFPDEVESSSFIEEYDDRIEVIGGIRKINVDKLIFDQDNKTYVLYKSFYMEFAREDVPETYSMMLKNPAYNYRYVANKESDSGVIDVLFKSLYGGSEVIVKVMCAGGKIISFEVIR